MIKKIVLDNENALILELSSKDSAGRANYKVIDKKRLAEITKGYSATEICVIMEQFRVEEPAPKPALKPAPPLKKK